MTEANMLVDETALKADIKLLAEHASKSGKLVVASYAEDPATGIELKPIIHHFPAHLHEEAAEIAIKLNKQEHRNVYITFANMKEKIGAYSKGAEADVISVWGLVADFDAKNDDDASNWLNRLPLPPTMVLETSSYPASSYQCRFLFSSPIAPEKAKTLAAKLVAYCGCDTASKDISHVWRPAGSLNWPNKVKFQSGRPLIPQQVRIVVEYDSSHLVTAEQLEQALGEVEIINPVRPTALCVDVNFKNLPVLQIADELPQNIPNRVKELILTGRSEKYPSRSEALFAVVCGLMRHSIAHEVIYAIITSPAFGISASVLDKKMKAHDYAVRQIARAQEKLAAENGDPVSWVNQQYFSALEGGKVAFYREENDGSVVAMNKAAFFYELQPKVAQVGKEKSQYAVLWCADDRRRYYKNGFTLDPNSVTDEDKYNLWKGFGVDAAPGTWALLKRHIYEVLADSNSELAEYIIKWTAWSFQNPATPPRVALVFKGGEGIGKGLFGNALCQIFGKHSLRVQHMIHVVGRFNAHLRHCCFLYADEISLPGNDNAGAFKGLITEPNIPIERKGVDVVDAENHLHIVMASNNDWVIPAGEDARRFAVFKVSGHRKGDKDYFNALYAEMKDGGLEAMLYDLQRLDIKDWHPASARPDTPELVRQKLQSLPPIERCWYDFLHTGILPAGERLSDGSIHLPTTPLVEEIRRISRREDVTANKVTEMLSERVFGFRKDENKRPRGYEIPPLPVARKLWDEKKFPVKWGSEVEWLVERRGGVQDTGSEF